MPLIGGVTQTVNNPSSGGGLLESILNAAGGVAGALGGLGGSGGETTYSPMQQQQANQIALAIMSPPKKAPLVAPTANIVPMQAPEPVLLAQNQTAEDQGRYNRMSDVPPLAPSMILAQNQQPTAPAQSVGYAPPMVPQYDEPIPIQSHPQYASQFPSDFPTNAPQAPSVVAPQPRGFAPALPGSPYLDASRQAMRQSIEQAQQNINNGLPGGYIPPLPMQPPSYPGYAPNQGMMGKIGNYLQRLNQNIDPAQAYAAAQRFAQQQRAYEANQAAIADYEKQQAEWAAHNQAIINAKVAAGYNQEAALAAKGADILNKFFDYYTNPSTLAEALKDLKDTPSSSDARAKVIADWNAKSQGLINLDQHQDTQFISTGTSAEDQRHKQAMAPLQERDAASRATKSAIEASHAGAMATADQRIKDAQVKIQEYESNNLRQVTSSKQQDELAKRIAAEEKIIQDSMDDLQKSAQNTIRAYHDWQGKLTESAKTDSMAPEIGSTREQDRIRKAMAGEMGNIDPMPPSPGKDLSKYSPDSYFRFLESAADILGANASEDDIKQFIQRHGQEMESRSKLVPPVVWKATLQTQYQAEIRKMLTGKGVLKAPPPPVIPPNGLVPPPPVIPVSEMQLRESVAESIPRRSGRSFDDAFKQSSYKTGK